MPPTVAVNVTDCPNALGLADDETVVVVTAAVTAVVASLVLLSVSGSAVLLDTVAVLVTLAGAELATVAWMLIVAEPPLERLDKLQVALLLPMLATQVP
jgi:hypothetical protein